MTKVSPWSATLTNQTEKPASAAMRTYSIRELSAGFEVAHNKHNPVNKAVKMARVQARSGGRRNRRRWEETWNELESFRSDNSAMRWR